MNFAKLFTYPTGQLLVTLDHDEESEKTKVTYRSDGADLSVSATKTFKTESIAQKAFEEVDDTTAEAQFNGMQKMMNR